MFENLEKWLSGSFSCYTCGEKYHIMGFGFGEGICPDCYSKEPRQPIHSFDMSYPLNRLIVKISNYENAQFVEQPPAIDLEK